MFQLAAFYCLAILILFGQFLPVSYTYQLNRERHQSFIEIV